MEISKAIHFWKAYNVRSTKNNVYICAAPLDPRCHGNENLAISTQNLLYLGLYKRYNGASRTKLGVYKVRQFNDVNEI